MELKTLSKSNSEMEDEISQLKEKCHQIEKAIRSEGDAVKKGNQKSIIDKVELEIVLKSIFNIRNFEILNNLNYF